jgi:hypothetical protein
MLDPRHGCARSFEHTSGRGRNFRADSIARDEYDLMRCHLELQPQE